MIERSHCAIGDVRHIKLCGSRETYCGHPRQCGIYNFGGGEIAVLHHHAPCAYSLPPDVVHDYGGYHSRAVVLLQRSTDGGETWPQGNSSVVYAENASLEEKRAFLFKGTAREEMDMSSPDAVFFFGRTYAGELQPFNDSSRPDIKEMPAPVCFCMRSADRGHTWEKAPTIIHPPAGKTVVYRDNHPPVRMPDGSFVAAFSCSTTWPASLSPGTCSVVLYGSDDDGLSWVCLSEVASDPTGRGRPTYVNLLLLPDGRLQCYMLNINGISNAIGMNDSEDGGYSWSPPRPIVCFGDSPWVARRPRDGNWQGTFAYRSPWPMLLRDGRILVLFARRRSPCGIGGIISKDMGQTWSREFVIRDDASSYDIGYPVATELEDGRIFTAYYYTLEDGNPFGGSRFIAGSFFKFSQEAPQSVG